MSRWISRKPDHHADLNAAIPNFVTRSCTLLATGYAKLMEQNGGRIPAKNGLDISSFGPAMANTALAAVTLGSSCIFRITGEGLKENFAQKLVGTDYYGFVDLARRSCAMKSFDMAVSVPCAFRTELLQKYDNGEEGRSEACAFPLLSDEQDVDGFILIANEETDRARSISMNKPVMIESWVIQRELIDLGFGIDESFEDLVPGDLIQTKNLL